MFSTTRTMLSASLEWHSGPLSPACTQQTLFHEFSAMAPVPNLHLRSRSPPGLHTITQKSNFLLPLGSLSELTPLGASQIPLQGMDVLCAPVAPSCKHRNWVCAQGGCSALITSGFTGHRAASLQPLHRQAFSRF